MKKYKDMTLKERVQHNEYKRDYKNARYKILRILFRKDAHADVIEYFMPIKNKADYIADLIRKDMQEK